MLGLLNPFLLWFAPLLAAPLVIHFLGRAQPRTRDFPSLLPVRGVLARAMHRHRLKNWLLLVLRTLALLCLLLAAAGPVWRGGGFAPPAATALLLHNGAYAEAPHEDGGTWLDAQRRLARALDSIAPGRGHAARVIPDAEGAVAERFGDWPGAAARLLRETPEREAHAYFPVFDARDLEAFAPALRGWLEARPQARAVLLDYTAARGGLDAFGEAAARFTPEGTMIVRLPARANDAPLWTSGRNPDGGARETRLSGGAAEIALPLPEAGWVTGNFVLADEDQKRYAPASRRAAVAVRVPAPLRLCHVSARTATDGGAVSRATLGEEGPRLRIASASDETGLGAEACGTLYLADPGNAGPLLARAASVLRAGGRVIVGAGIRSDAALLNRNLLAPLGVGRFTGIRAGEARVVPRASALARFGARAASWGEPGTVRTRLGFTAAPGTSVLLSARGASGDEPILVHRRVGRGELLLWTTDISDPSWSDLGAGPWPALMHAAFLAGAGTSEPELRAVDSDSTAFFAGAGESVLIGPDGAASSRWRPEAGARARAPSIASACTRSDPRGTPRGSRCASRPRGSRTPRTRPGKPSTKRSARSRPRERSASAKTASGGTFTEDSACARPCCFWPHCYFSPKARCRCACHLSGTETSPMPIRGTTRLLGILGNPLDHSWSPAMHNSALEALGLDYAYVPFAGKAEDLPTLLAALKGVNFAGANVTMPHKQAVMGLLDGVSELSSLLGAVNTLSYRDGKLTGHTTDPEGFLRGFDEAGHDFGGKSVAILGNGGSARTIAFTLLWLAEAKPARVALAARAAAKSQAIAREVLDKTGARLETLSLDAWPDHAGDFDIVVNTTPLGMASDPEAMPIPAGTIRENQIVYDIISNPEETALMRAARVRGAAAVGGLGMLVHQGVASFRLWTGVDPDPALFYAGIRRQQAAMKAAAA